MDWLHSEELKEKARDGGLLLLRLSIGSMMLFGHGWGKLANFSEVVPKFPGLFGMSPSLALAMAIGAEVGCSALLMLGAATRLAAIPLAFTMLVAVIVVHGGDPWAKKEIALLYLVPALTLLLTGPGRFSLDAALWPRIEEKLKAR